MANLGNLKIKDTYQLVLQTDAAGNLQKLDGSTPNPFSGNIVSISGLSWSANTNGDISNSGLTGKVGIGTATPDKALTVAGDISATGNISASGTISFTLIDGGTF